MADEELDPQTKLTRALWDDPEARPLMEEAFAKKFPDKAKVLLPGRELRLQTAAELAEIRKERADWRAEVDQEKQKRVLEAERDKIRAKGISDDEIPVVEKLMTERLIGDHETAAEFYRNQQRNQVAAPRSIYSTMDVPGTRAGHADYFKGINGGPSIIQDRDKWSRDVADQIAHDFATNPSAAAQKWG